VSDEKEIKVYSDVPTGSALALAHTPEQAQALARRIAGELPPDECEFHCVNCGQSKTLKFEPDEMEALDGDIRGYTGPCWSCGYMTLRPKDEFVNGETISAAARKQRLAEYHEQADVLVNRVKQEVASVITGQAPRPEPAPTEPAPPGSHVENLQAAMIGVLEVP